MDGAHHLLDDGVLLAPGGIRHALALAQVGAAAEAAGRACQDEAGRDVGVDVEASEQVAQLAHHGGVHGVADLGPAHRDDAHPVGADLDLQRLVIHVLARALLVAHGRIIPERRRRAKRVGAGSAAHEPAPQEG